MASEDCFVLIEKAAHRMTVMRQGVVVKTYRVSLGKGGLAPKTHEGDNRTPEGRYRITGRNPQSAFHLSLRLSYPELRDIERAQALGLTPGGDIMIHGQRNGSVGVDSTDWTAGCVAVSNEAIEEIWALVPDGTKVEIRP